MNWEGGFVELVYGIVLFVVYDGMQDTLIGEGIQALLLVAFKELLLRGREVDLTLQIVFFLVLLRHSLLLLGLIDGKS